MAEPRIQRRLAAILAADVAGYSRLMGADEEGTLARLKAHRVELIEPSLSTHGGRLVKLMGDGALVEFASVVDAVRCAAEIQKGMAERNTAEPEDQRIKFRIGINLGDIIIDGDDIHGDGVNVAARVEALAVPGGICVTEIVRQSISGKLDVAFEDMGLQSLKNIAAPIRTYRMKIEKPVPLPDVEREALPLPDKPSIAVLPFQNMSGDPDQEYFADGMAEDIITALSRFRWFFVIARNSSFTYKGKAVDVRQIGRELGVRYVLEGSVRKGGNRLRITAQLIEADTGNHIWAERYDGALEDVFDLQDSITEGVVGAIEPSIQKAEIERARRKRTENSDAYDLLLRALPHLWLGSINDADKAITLVDQALLIDPDYAFAHSVAAFCHLHRWRSRGEEEERAHAVAHARKVVSSNSDDAVALCYAGFALVAAQEDRDGGLAAVSRAIELSPNSAAVLARAALTHAITEHNETAIDQARRAIRLSPHDPMRYSVENALGTALFYSGRYTEALEAIQRAIKYNPRFDILYAMLVASYWRLGRAEDAKQALRRLLEISPGFQPSYGSFSESVVTALREVGLPE